MTRTRILAGDDPTLLPPLWFPTMFGPWTLSALVDDDDDDESESPDDIVADDPEDDDEDDDPGDEDDEDDEDADLDEGYVD